MEGSYDKVWSEMKGEKVPSEEFAVFSEVSCCNTHLLRL
jgi:26S proteasome regulatory subunit N12